MSLLYKNNIQMENPNTYLDFVTYLMIYAANIDTDFAEEEKQFIQSKCSQAEFDTMNELFKSHNDFESIEFIQAGAKEWITNEESKQNLIKQITELTEADNKIDAMETAFLSMLNKLI